MTTLYQLTKDLLEKFAILEARTENGETLSNEALEETLQLGEDTKEKAVNVGKYIKNLESDSDQLGEEIKRLQAKKKAIDNRVGSLKDYLLWQMQQLGFKEIGDKVFSIKIQNNSVYSVNVENATALPPEYQVTKIEADKKALLEAWKQAGNDENFMQGVTVNKGCHLRIG